MSCFIYRMQKNDDRNATDDILQDKYLVFDENFDGTNNWEIAPSFSYPTGLGYGGSYSGEISNGMLHLGSSGCANGDAYLPLTIQQLTEEKYGQIYLSIDISSFKCDIGSGSIEIGLNKINVEIELLENFDNLLLTFKADTNSISISGPAEGIIYSYNTGHFEEKISVSVGSGGMADCVGEADLKLNSIKIYKK